MLNYESWRGEAKIIELFCLHETLDEAGPTRHDIPRTKQKLGSSSNSSVWNRAESVPVERDLMMRVVVFVLFFLTSSACDCEGVRLSAAKQKLEVRKKLKLLNKAAIKTIKVYGNAYVSFFFSGSSWLISG